jgi:hypothetical protein
MSIQSVERYQMAQVFNRRTNKIVRLSIFVGIPLVLALLSTAWWYYTRSDWIRDVRPANAKVQPGGGYSHQLHVGGLKLDCRYCHTAVEVSKSANIPHRDLHGLSLASIDQEYQARVHPQQLCQGCCRAMEQGPTTCPSLSTSITVST